MLVANHLTHLVDKRAFHTAYPNRTLLSASHRPKTDCAFVAFIVTVSRVRTVSSGGQPNETDRTHYPRCHALRKRDGVEVPNHGVDDTEVDIELLGNVWSSSGQYEGYILYRVK